MSRFIKILIIVNGLIIPTICCVLLYKLLEEYFRPSGPEESVIVGAPLEQAKKDSVALQGISYSTPIAIYNSTNFYLPISVRTYEEPKRIAKLGIDSSPTFRTEPNYDRYINVLFLDKDYKPIGKLLDRKASITEINIPGERYPDNEVDKTVKNISFLIAFADTNHDGKLNADDDHDLYISDLDGSHLTQVSKKVDVQNYNFVKSNSAILISFKDRSTASDEHKRNQFAVYDIAANTFTVLTDVHTYLNDIESILIK